MAQGPAEHLAFFRRYSRLWSVSALVWGLTTLLYFDRTSLADQFICWLIMAGLAMFSINSLSSHLATLRAYLDTLALTALAVMLWRVGVQLQFHGPYYHYWVVLLLVIFWQVLQAGRAAPARHAPQELRTAIPQQPADRIAHAPDAGRARRGGDQEPVPGQRRARHPPARARPQPVCGLAGQRARPGARDRPQDRRIHQGGERAVRLAVRPRAPGLRQDQADHRTGGPGPADPRPRTAVPAAGAGQGPGVPHPRDAGHRAVRSRSCCAASWATSCPTR